MIPGRQQVGGKFSASTQLWGGGEIHSLRGEGKMRLREADVYQLPVMVALLKVLSVRAPDSTAFTDGDIDYRVEGNHVYLDRINVKGDAVSLLGRGEANLDRQINLNFYTVVGRDELQLPILRPGDINPSVALGAKAKCFAGRMVFEHQIERCFGRE